MSHHIIELIAQYGLLLVFVNVLVEQAGVPVPAVPTMIVAGALASMERLPLAGVVAVALVACLLADYAWYVAGRHFGGSVMRTLCRISLSPDSCVRQSELRFQRWRGSILLLAKFVPGLSTVAPPLVGAMGLRTASFILFDGLGSLMWVGMAVSLGYVFANQIDAVLMALANAGSVALMFIGSLLALYVIVKWWQRHHLMRTLRMARITVEELNDAVMQGRKPVVVDVRSDGARLVDSRVIPGALLADVNSIERIAEAVPPDTELVLYCTCPNEYSAALVAKALMLRGYKRVRPLLGGLDAWDAAGYPVDRVPVADEVVVSHAV
ncbi:membrane protein DedA, SNARE-associated domain [Dyella jiangningensis]|uniref:VTT domain-containing protein n=1 Tax=Dyella sp. AtDHG13 TaxID=1938897 RepID=UPI00088A90D2|nr:VTT domain-containing protein [Dyella sp. AtDHG13]PXV59856.1 membrane protein DedA with SNARE-associated domain [Dyella sp. AtDHG13]SDJ19951.1 membrane protein DedA, SNARE-associated domain [Dyella jiangningensis]